MGQLIDGVWTQDTPGASHRGGTFVRRDSGVRNWVTCDGAPGPTGVGGFKAEPGRYHLYVSLACPWAHRTLIMRALKALQGSIGLSVVHWLMLENGWTFAIGPGVVPDPVLGARYLHELYTCSDPGYTGRVTVPVLWDKQTGRIVSNESADIIRMMNLAFDGAGAETADYFPSAWRDEIDAVNARVYETLNNGVYRAGFATTQAAYEDAVVPLFGTLDWLEDRLRGRSYLCGDHLTEADVRAFTTLIRFDAVYHGHFKCNLHRIVDYPELSRYLALIYGDARIQPTVDMMHIKHHYYESHRHINPTGIVPAGPALVVRSTSRQA